MRQAWRSGDVCLVQLLLDAGGSLRLEPGQLDIPPNGAGECRTPLITVTATNCVCGNIRQVYVL